MVETQSNTNPIPSNNKYTDEKYIQENYRYYIGTIWIITLIILILVYLYRNSGTNMGYQQKMPYNMGFQPLMQPNMGFQQPMQPNMGFQPPMGIPIEMGINALPPKYRNFARMMSGGTKNRKPNIQYGGLIWKLFSSGAMEYIAYMIPILSATILTIYILWRYAKKSKCIAYILAFVPIIPASRIYMGNFFSLWTLAYIVPGLGNIIDIILLFLNKINPSTGWEGDGTCKLI